MEESKRRYSRSNVPHSRLLIVRRLHCLTAIWRRPRIFGHHCLISQGCLSRVSYVSLRLSTLWDHYANWIRFWSTVENSRKYLGCKKQLKLDQLVLLESTSQTPTFSLRLSLHGIYFPWNCMDCWSHVKGLECKRNLGNQWTWLAMSWPQTLLNV